MKTVWKGKVSIFLSWSVCNMPGFTWNWMLNTHTWWSQLHPIKLNKYGPYQQLINPAHMLWIEFSEFIKSNQPVLAVTWTCGGRQSQILCLVLVHNTLPSHHLAFSWWWFGLPNHNWGDYIFFIKLYFVLARKHYYLHFKVLFFYILRIYKG